MAVAHKGSISMGMVLIPIGLYKTTDELVYAGTVSWGVRKEVLRALTKGVFSESVGQRLMNFA